MVDSTVLYQFLLEFHPVQGQTGVATQVALQVDWEPLFDHIRLQALRRESPLAAAGATSVEPIWHAALGEPYVDGIAAAIAGHAQRLTTEVSTAYFQGSALRMQAELIESGKLDAEQSYRPLVTAFRVPASLAAAHDGFHSEPVVQTTLVMEKPISRLLDDAIAYGPGDDHGPPVFIPHYVIDEAVAIHRQVSTAETGGVLLGQVCRDPVNRRQLFVEVTAQIPARRAIQASMQLTLTPQVWADVRAAIRLRNRGELWVGYWHTHPDWCQINSCPLEKRRACALGQEFFSEQDVQVLRSVFSPAYCVGLVISENSMTGLSWPLFGWWEGTVKKRGYYLTGATPAAAAVDVAAPAVGNGAS
jgi:hypothetical protein